jgi:hypothetical protein
VTIEEAIEVILGKKCWHKCMFCNGMGYYQRDGGLMDCDKCDRFGYILDKDYEEACVMLDRPLPPAPPSGIRFVATEKLMRTFPINKLAIGKLMIE